MYFKGCLPKTNEAIVDLDKIDSLNNLISNHSKNHGLLKILKKGTKEIISREYFIDIVESEYFTIDEIIDLLRIFSFSIKHSSDKTTYSNLEIIEKLLRIYLKLDLLQSSHEIHHLPVINLFQELIEFLNRQRDDDILRNFPTNLKLTLEEFSKLDFCKELEKLLKNLNKKIDSVKSLFEG